MLGLGLLVCQLAGQGAGLLSGQVARVRCAAASDEQEHERDYLSCVHMELAQQLNRICQR